MSATITNKVRFPYLLEDMVIVLMRCLAEPPRLKTDHVSFLKKVEEQLSNQLVEIPPHLSGHFQTSNTERLAEAVRFLFNLHLTTKAGLSSKSMNLVITEFGHKWLNSSTEKKLETIYSGLCEAKRTRRIAYINTFKFSPCPIPLMVRREDFEPTSDLIKAFGSLVVDEYILFDQFIDHQVKVCNPLRAIAADSGFASITIGHDHFVKSTGEVDLIWADYLKNFLFTRLFALGAVTFASGDNGQLALALNTAGSYLLGLSETFSYADSNSDKILIVQPDFDIVFLAPSPVVESKLTPFAQRLSSGIGVLFKITRASIMAAASVEMTADDVLFTLAEHCLQPVSSNVEIEIRGWFDQCSYFEGHETYIIKCPDHTTMMRVLEIAGSLVTPISDTVLELNDLKRKLTCLKLLKDNGVFLK